MKKVLWVFIIAMMISQQVNACGVLLSEEGTNIRVDMIEAIMQFDKKEEKEDLIIKINYLQNEGETEKFGWLMPFPTKPKVNKMDKHIFKKMEAETKKKENSLEKILNYKNSWGFTSGRDKSAGLSKGEGVTVIEEKTIGAFDTVIVQAENTNDLKEWARKNEYHISWENSGMLEEYIQKKWYFVLMKMNKGKSVNGDIQVMKFSFKTKEAIFPIQLTKYDRFGKHNPEKTIPFVLYIVGSEKMKPTNYELTYEYGGKVSGDLKNEFNEAVYISKWTKTIYGEEVKDEMFFTEDNKMENKNDGSVTIVDIAKLIALLMIFPYYVILHLLLSGGTFAVLAVFTILLVIMYSYAREKEFKDTCIYLYDVFGFIAVFYIWSVYPYYVICYLVYHMTKILIRKKKSYK